MTMDQAVLAGTPQSVLSCYETLAQRAQTRAFGLIEQDIIVLDTETTGLSLKDCGLIEISAALLRGREIVDRFHTLVDPGLVIPNEIVELTGITNDEIKGAPTPAKAVKALAEFVDKRPVVAHNAAFDRGFIEAASQGVVVSEVWIDSLALSRIALPRLASHKLSFMAELFGCVSVSHRADADVEALCGVWRVLLTALADLPSGLLGCLADMHPEVPWAYRPLFSHLAAETPEAPFSLVATRTALLQEDREQERIDAFELDHTDMPSPAELDNLFAPHGLVASMYSGFEERPGQIRMAQEVRQAIAEGSHRAIEAGTGVGKSMAYLVPLIEASRRNNVTVGVATKSNNLADQLIYHELPKLSAQYAGGVSFCALKGYDHYPCLRKLERLARGTQEIQTKKDPADTLTAIAVIYAFACQSPAGDMDALGIRWKSVKRADLTTTSRECARRLCPFYPHTCLVHGARRRAAEADVVVTNHSLLFRNAAADGKILPPIRHWVIDEAHSVESEARRQWARTVSADEARALFERLGTERTGAFGTMLKALASSDAATLYMGITAKALSACTQASWAMANLFSALRTFAASGRSGYESAHVWIGPEVRDSASWVEFLEPAQHAFGALEHAQHNLESLVQTLGAEKPNVVTDLAESSRRMRELTDALGLILAGTDERYVYSLHLNRRQRVGGEMLLAEPLDVGEILADQWFTELQTAIFTSATMSVAGDFSHFLHSVGLDRASSGHTKTLQLDSDYNYDLNMKVFVAQDVPDPRDREAYLDALEQLLVDIHIAMRGSVLTLFTNRRDMEELYKRVHPHLQAEGLVLDCQLHTTSARELRNRFVSQTSSSLFALKAFWEGFDAAGETLRCVVIPKLPFASPTDPLSCERARREKSAWAHYALPHAVLEVKQAAGRLIRTSTDVGVLVLADSRLVTKGYGKKFLNSLPTAEYRSIASWKIKDEVAAWRRAHPID